MEVKTKTNRALKQLNSFLEGLVKILSFSASKTRGEIIKEKRSRK